MITNFSVGTSTATAAYTASGDVAVTVIYICNTSATDGDVDVYLVPNGQSVGSRHLIYKNLIIRSNDTYIIDSEKLILGTGDKIDIAAPDSAGEFTATISTIGI